MEDVEDYEKNQLARFPQYNDDYYNNDYDYYNNYESGNQEYPALPTIPEKALARRHGDYGDLIPSQRRGGLTPGQRRGGGLAPDQRRGGGAESSVNNYFYQDRRSFTHNTDNRSHTDNRTYVDNRSYSQNTSSNEHTQK